MNDKPFFVLSIGGRDAAMNDRPFFVLSIGGRDAAMNDKPFFVLSIGGRYAAVVSLRTRSAPTPWYRPFIGFARTAWLCVFARTA